MCSSDLAPLLCIPVLLVLYPGHYTHRAHLALALGAYVLAKGAEHFDRAIFAVTGEAVSGHTLKHLLAALAIAALLDMLARRAPRSA